jgi:prepilin-type N-terminal cleavage/methylation domain-containing protein
MMRRPRNGRGMTLIEVMIALVILTGALLGMGKFITSFSHATSDGALSSVASDLVLDRLETTRARARTRRSTASPRPSSRSPASRATSA